MSKDIDSVKQNYRAHNKADRKAEKYENIMADGAESQAELNRLREEETKAAADLAGIQKSNTTEIAKLQDELKAMKLIQAAKKKPEAVEQAGEFGRQLLVSIFGRDLKGMPNAGKIHVGAGLRIGAINEKIAELKTGIEDARDNWMTLVNKAFKYQGGALYKADKAQAKADLVGEEIGYRFASSDSNCASMAIRALRSGGADEFVEYKDITFLGANRPDENFANYAASVQTELDQWNHRAESVMTQLERSSPTERTAVQHDLILVGIKFNGLKPQMSSEEVSAWDEASKIFSEITNTPPISEKELLDRGKRLVIAVEKVLVNLSSGPEQSGMVELLNGVFNLHKRHIVDLTCLN